MLSFGMFKVAKIEHAEALRAGVAALMTSDTVASFVKEQAQVMLDLANEDALSKRESDTYSVSTNDGRVVDATHWKPYKLKVYKGRADTLAAIRPATREGRIHENQHHALARLGGVGTRRKRKQTKDKRE